MSNIDEQGSASVMGHPRLINKPILTPTEAAELLGMSRCTLKAYNVPRHYMNRANQWYLLDELIDWVKAWPIRGEMPQEDEYYHEIRVMS